MPETLGQGPAVWRGMTQSLLDAEYDQRTLVPDLGPHIARWANWSAAVREAYPGKTMAYGAAPEESVDVFSGAGDGPVHLHFHGGAWRAMSKQDAHFVVDGLRPLARAVALAGFGLAPQTRLTTIAAQVRTAAASLIREHGQISVSGHSSGAHLASLLLDRRWWAEAGVSAAQISWVLLASGPYDLEPVRLSSRNLYLTLTPEEVDALSVRHHLARDLPPVAVVWGSGELGEFRRQGAAMAEALAAQGGRVIAEEFGGLNHFQMWDAFHDAGSPILRTVRALEQEARSRAGT